MITELEEKIEKIVEEVYGEIYFHLAEKVDRDDAAEIRLSIMRAVIKGIVLERISDAISREIKTAEEVIDNTLLLKKHLDHVGVYDNVIDCMREYASQLRPRPSDLKLPEFIKSVNDDGDNIIYWRDKEILYNIIIHEDTVALSAIHNNPEVKSEIVFHDIPKSKEIVDPIEKEVNNKLQEFKDYVHKRLDDAGIEKEPNGDHSKHGCRIGDRLDLVLNQKASNSEIIKDLKELQEAFIEEGNVTGVYWKLVQDILSKHSK